MSLKVAVLASGGGSNLQALLDAFAGSDLVRIQLVVSDRASAGALGRARMAGVRERHIPATRESELLEALLNERIDIVALAGYLRLVPPTVVQRFRDRILNIHPSLLPCFGGAGMYGVRVHQAVLDAGCRVTGATVHYVNERYDEGSIVAQWPVPVLHDDTPQLLAERVLRIEHMLYPAALHALAAGIAEASEHPAPTMHAFRLGHAEGAEEDMRASIRVDGRLG